MLHRQKTQILHRNLAFPEYSKSGCSTIPYDYSIRFPDQSGSIIKSFKKADDTLQEIDLWESAEKFQEFGKTLMPVLTKVFGEAPQPPAIYSLYNTAGK